MAGDIQEDESLQQDEFKLVDPRMVFEKSLTHGDPFSEDPVKRKNWLDNLEIPRVELTAEQYATMRPLSDVGGYKKAHTIEINGKRYFISFARVSEYADKLQSDPNFFDDMIGREYAANLVGSCAVDSGVFVMPYGAIYTPEGKMNGLLTELVLGAENLQEFCDDSGYIRSDHRPGGKLEKAAFERYREGVNKFTNKNMYILDMHKENVLIDNNFNLRPIDLRYYPEVGFDFWGTPMEGMTIPEVSQIVKEDLNKVIDDWERRLV